MKKEQLIRLKKDPKKYEQYLKKQKDYQRKTRLRLKQLTGSTNPYMQQYQRTHRAEVNSYQRERRLNSETGDKVREYFRNYMRNYRANNVNNINEKEKVYNQSRRIPLEVKIQKLERQINNLKKQLKYEQNLKLKYKNKYKELKEGKIK